MIFNRNTLAAFALATGITLAPVAAQAEEATFERDGTSFVYNATVENGRTVIVGKADQVPFRLVVRGQNVSGHYNKSPVQFSLRDVQVSTEKLASR